MKINLEELRKRSKYIHEQKHPTLDLLIWNYTQECQFAKAWDDYTMMCRGLITDSEGNIIARPFKKFFNWGEKDLDSIPTEMPIISEKMDGSLGILYFDREKPYIATRGSFSSDQANWGTHFINQISGLNKNDFKEKYTYLFEIIYPENRIVVDYGNRKDLVLLAVINTETGEELDVKEEAERLHFNFAQQYQVDNIQDILNKTETLSGNEEGYVFYWPQKDFRLKIKGKEYVRLHKLLTEFSTISIWECLKENQPLEELLEKVPDEFFNWVRNVKSDLENQYREILEESIRAYEDVVNLQTRKEQALAIKEKYPKISGLVFALLDKKDLSQIIWRMIRPKYSKPFSKDIDL